MEQIRTVTTYKDVARQLTYCHLAIRNAVKRFSATIVLFAKSFFIGFLIVTIEIMKYNCISHYRNRSALLYCMQIRICQLREGTDYILEYFC